MTFSTHAESFCLKPPHSLVRLQEWFGETITRPLGAYDSIQTHTARGLLIAEESSEYVVPSATLRPHKRVEIYNQQYWWRLLSTLHHNFPFLVRLFGYYPFNEQIGIPYLGACPSQHWSLNHLGDRMSSWLRETYHHADQGLVCDAAELDWAFASSFVAPQSPSLSLEHCQDPQILLAGHFALQPSVYLFEWSYDLLSLRREFLKESVEHWVEHPFPHIDKDRTYRFVLYRTHDLFVAWHEISEQQLSLLRRFQQGGTLDEICSWIEASSERSEGEMGTALQKWLCDWTRLGLFAFTQDAELAK